MKLGDTQALDVESVSTGSLGLDVALGIGGLPMGRIVEIDVYKRQHPSCLSLPTSFPT